MSDREGETGEWRDRISREGIGCSLNSKTDFTGREIFFNLDNEKTTVSAYFLAKWRNANPNLRGVLSYGVILTTVKIGDSHYPIFANVTNDFRPLTLGYDFFSAFEWHLNEEGNITTPGGCVQLVPGHQQIDTQLVEDVYKCNEVLSQNRPRHLKLAKLHKYFAHASAESLWRLIKHSSNPDSFTQTKVATTCESCPTCQVHRKNMPRKKTSLPRSTAFNQVVSIDLKCHGDGTYVLWLVDDATRLIAGQAISNKQPETIMTAIYTAWIMGHGKGPGLPEKYFLADNGREFVNEKLLDLLQAAGISLKTTASYSPTMNGMNERNHAIADKIVEKLRHEDPNMTMQQAVDKAAWAKNTLINTQRGFSPFQMIYGRNPSIPGISECTTGSLENLSHNEIARKIIESMQSVRLQMLASEYDHRIKVAFKDNLPKSTNFKYDVGDQVVFKDTKDGRMHDARIVGIDGPVAILRWGNSERRAQMRELLPSREIKLLEEPEEEPAQGQSEYDPEDGQTETDHDEIIPEIVPRTRSTFRSDKEWIIPEISEREVVRMFKTLEADADSETDNEPHIEVWTDEESRSVPGSKKIPNLPRPARYEWIEVWNEHGEKFTGRVTGFRKTNPRLFYLMLGPNVGQWIDLERLNYWDYCEPPESVHFGCSLG